MKKSIREVLERNESNITGPGALAAINRMVEAQNRAEVTRQKVKWQRRAERAKSGTFADRCYLVPEVPGVYIIGSPFLGLYKIGMASNLRNRLLSYTGFPVSLDYTAIWPYRTPSVLEDLAHITVDHARLRENGSVSEWFCLRTAEVQALEQTLSQAKLLSLVASEPFFVEL